MTGGGIVPDAEQDLRRRVIELVQPLLTAQGLTLVDCRISRAKRGAGVALAVDGPEPLTVQDYAKLGRFLDDVLAGELPDLGDYRLEVGSPGLERVLRSELELAWALGRRVQARIRHIEQDSEQKSDRDGDKITSEELIGVLEEVDARAVVLRITGEGEEMEHRRVPREDLDRLRLYHEWPRRFRSQRRNKRRKR
ncbi:MAG: hypothetical protein GF403_05905 [Candidatus Coatesbacteria bacterium]|nr:hypothetical protein [Candidatus Coatesbacteria bacterium]